MNINLPDNPAYFTPELIVSSLAATTRLLGNKMREVGSYKMLIADVRCFLDDSAGVLQVTATVSPGQTVLLLNAGVNPDVAGYIHPGNWWYAVLASLWPLVIEAYHDAESSNPILYYRSGGEYNLDLTTE